MVSFSFGWRHVVGLWLRCMTWRWLISLNSISLYSALLLYIYILYIVYWQFVECSKTMPFLAGTCCTECNWRADWLVDYNWKWPLTLCAIVPCALVMFYFLLWGSCVWMYCIFYFSISSHSHQQCFLFFFSSANYDFVFLWHWIFAKRTLFSPRSTAV